jgi:predicted nucleic acid-binding protein
MTVLVDSDILIEVSQGKDAAILDRWTALAESDDIVLVSPVSVAELWHGARPAEHHALSDLFEALACPAIGAGIAREAGDYLRQYRKSHNLELGDALIAATAATQKAALWTRNRKHYPMKDITFY